MSRSLPASRVAREFLELSQEHEQRREPWATMLHLIKWTFLAHGWGYAAFDRPLVSDPVEAWQYGPVFPELYRSLKSFKKGPVSQVPLGAAEQLSYSEEDLKLLDDEKKLIVVIYNAHKDLSGSQLITLTHKKGTPWHKNRHRVSMYWDREISQEDIRDYYIKQVRA